MEKEESVLLLAEELIRESKATPFPAGTFAFFNRGKDNLSAGKSLYF